MNHIRLLTRALPYALCILFFIAYSTLSIVRHNNYQSFGYDLGINDQAVWRYSTFQLPLTTIDPFPDKLKFYTHVELIYAIISPFYWIWDSRQMLLILQSAFVCLGGIAVYLLAKKKGLQEFPSLGILIGYLGFYGVQNAVYSDVHSISFGVAFLGWFLYFLDSKKLWPSILFFFLAITTKENVAFITLFIAVVYYVKRRDKLSVYLSLASAMYLFFVFFIFFPYIIHATYLYGNNGGIFSNLGALSLFNSPEKLQTMFYSIFSFGFVPLLLPFSLLPALADLATYFVFGSNLSSAQGLFMQYRIMLAPLLAWATILTIARYKQLNNKYVGAYLISCVIVIQLLLHLPLSYLTKQWFWTSPPAVNNINEVRDKYLSPTASVVAQNNIIPHISHRDKIYELYPFKRDFSKNSPCGHTQCNWFRWFDHPEFLFVDTSPEWDTRHLLAGREDFIDGLRNLEKTGVITKYKSVGSAILYKVNQNPENYR